MTVKEKKMTAKRKNRRERLTSHAKKLMWKVKQVQVHKIPDVYKRQVIVLGTVHCQSLDRVRRIFLIQKKFRISRCFVIRETKVLLRG